MTQPIELAIAGTGRMGIIHAVHAQELARETGLCRVAALVDQNTERARDVARHIGVDVPVFADCAALAAAKVATATVIVTPTHAHQADTTTLLAAGQRVLLEKPLTGTLDGDTAFSAALDRDHPNGVMLAFQRRFDAALMHARELMQSGVVGRIFKIYSALEDSNPAPNGYVSGGILPDMSVHNVDEILWLTGEMPERALAIGSRIYSHRLTTSGEDFDDAMLLLWFAGERAAQVQVTRNHVSGYRVETVMYGEQGQIRIGRFEQRPLEVLVEAYGRRGTPEPIARRTFHMRQYGDSGLPEFVDRFGDAYKNEVRVFLECCHSGAAFPTSHRDGLRAQQVISAGMRAVIGKAQAAAVEA